MATTSVKNRETKPQKSLTEYSAKDIQILDGLDGVRKRPSMYIGSTGSVGLHHLVFEVVDNSIDEALVGRCDRIIVRILKGNIVEVLDNGHGIPVDMHKKIRKSALEVVMTKLHAGGKFDHKAYKVSGGLHGVGVSVVNALSEWLEATVYMNGKIHYQKYQRGKAITKLLIKGRTKERGTLIKFKPDKEIFTELEYNFDTLAKRLRELAFLNKGITIELYDLRNKTKKEHIFNFKGGIISFVSFLNKSKTAIHKNPVYITETKDDVIVELAMEYNNGFKEDIFTYVNNINTHEGGTHLSGFKSGLTRVYNDFLKKMDYDKKFSNNLSGDDVREGLTAVLSIKMKNPQFEGQTKMKLGNSEVEGIVYSIVHDKLTEYFDHYPRVVKTLLEKAIQSFRARAAAKQARDLIRRKDALDTDSGLPGKLADCIERKAENCEIYLVEGDSAGGTAKQARDRQFQAILPLKGKILNVEKARFDKLLANDELKTIITAFGAGIGEKDFNLEKLRYHKIIIMTDADVDGSHIRTLILTFLFRYMPALLENGHVYIAQPPLYKVSQGQQTKYTYTEAAKDRLVKEFSRQNKSQPIKLQRYKGLGEMNAEQLWDTTMNPDNRILVKVDLQDAVGADQIFSILMGDNVESRRQFIEQHAKKVRNLDI